MQECNNVLFPGQQPKKSKTQNIQADTELVKSEIINTTVIVLIVYISVVFVLTVIQFNVA